MATKECPKCESRNGLNMMKGEVVQLANAATKTPLIIDWTCGFCGYTDQDTSYIGSLGGSQNVKSMLNPEGPLAAAVPPPPEEPLQATTPPKPVEEPTPAEEE